MQFRVNSVGKATKKDDILGALHKLMTSTLNKLEPTY